jgi:deoxyribose-phosphate aldolase
VAQVHAQEKLLTVVLEPTLLDHEQRLKMIKLATDAGCDFLKNATGAFDTKFAIDDALQFRQDVPKSVGVKIVVDGATDEEMERLVAAGVERLALGQPLR